MLKRLMATTAIVAIASSAHAAGSQNNSAGMEPATADHYVTSVDASDLLATTLIGQAVYSGNPDQAMMPKAGTGDQAANNGAAQPQGEKIGDINNLLVAQNGSIAAVVIGVGGFLGIGEKNVAVPFDSLSWSVDANDNAIAHLAATKDQLKAAPSFDLSKLETSQNQQAGKPQAMANNPNTPQSGPGVAPAPGPAGQNVAANNPDSMATVDAGKISANDLMGTTVYDTQSRNVGEVADVIVTQDGQLDAVVIDVGGFLGIGEKPVALAFDSLDIRRDENDQLAAFTSFTEEQLNNAPEYNKEAYQQQREQMRLTPQG